MLFLRVFVSTYVKLECEVRVFGFFEFYSLKLTIDSC